MRKIKEFQQDELRAEIAEMVRCYTLDIGKSSPSSVYAHAVDKITAHAMTYLQHLDISELDKVFDVSQTEDNYPISYSVFVKRLRSLQQKTIDNKRNTAQNQSSSVGLSIVPAYSKQVKNGDILPSDAPMIHLMIMCNKAPRPGQSADEFVFEHRELINSECLKYNKTD